MAPRRVARAPKRAIKRVKYSNETFSNAISVTCPSNQLCNNYWIPVITPSQIAGMRKAKNFTITISCVPPADAVTNYQLPLLVSALLVYVPEGTDPTTPTFNLLQEPVYPNPATLTAIYKPDQNIIMSKVANISASGNLIMRNRLARNMNSGDQIGIILTVFSSYNSTDAQFNCLVSANYAVTY